ncbi:MAG TPA: helix-turn-helix transcriptional regulator [Candidatus Omnitrophota bacterium]|nr:helix-turn-helix transcriptional regulator [Candidatus Omnitrophota bacterium]
MQNHGDQIKKIRKEKGVTLIELAARMGVSQAYLVRIERNEVQPTEEQVEVIHAFLDEKL